MLNHITVSNKIYILSVGFIVLLFFVSFGAVFGMRSLHTALNDTHETNVETRAAGFIRTTLTEINRAHYILAANPAELDNVLKGRNDRWTTLNQAISTANAHADAEQKEMLKALDKEWALYRVVLEETFALVAKNKNSEISQVQREILDKVNGGKDNLEKLQKNLFDYVSSVEENEKYVYKNAIIQSEKIQIAIITFTFFSTVCGILIGWLIGQKGIVKPLSVALKSLKQLAGGNLSVTITGAGRQDEIGDIARALQVFQQNALERQQMRKIEAIAASEKLERAENVRKLVIVFENQVVEAVSLMSAAATELEATAHSLAATAEETSEQSGVVGSAATQTAANVQTVAAATEELNSTVREVARQMTEARQVAETATLEAETAQHHVTALTSSGQKIGEVIGLIQNIAAQTNLLALNATIEAARAGAAGKGFAVVASEVKALANQTARATDEIRTQVDAMQGSIGTAVRSIGSIGAVILRLNEMATAVAAAVEQQSVATAEIGRNAVQAAHGTSEVTLHIAEIQHASHNTAAGSGQVLGSAQEVAERIVVLKGNIDSFIADVRAA